MNSFRYVGNFDVLDAVVSALDQFGLPRAVGNWRTNRFIVWNESFRKQIQCSDEQLRSLALDVVVSLTETEALSLTSDATVAVFTSCAIKSADGRQIFKGQAAKRNDGFILLMPDPIARLIPSTEVQQRGGSAERNRLLKFFHDEIAPKLLVAIFEAECAKELSEAGDSPALEHVTKLSQVLIEIIDALIVGFEEIKPD